MNQLKMADVQSIVTLHSRGWSARRIAGELAVDRETVGRYLRLSVESVAAGSSDAPAGPSDSNPASAPTGIDGGSVSSGTVAGAPAGNDGAEGAKPPPELRLSNPAAPAGNEAVPSVPARSPKV